MLAFLKKIKKTSSSLGPGIITGAADDDPSGIATYSQTGAQFGYNQLWVAFFILPLMIAVQEASARIGAVKGKGIAAVVKEHFGKPTLFLVVGLILIANTINLGVDLGAMAAASNLILPIPFAILIIVFTAVILILEIYTSYHPYARILKWLSLSLLAYPATLLVVHQPWSEIIKATFLPHLEFNLSFLFIITGVIGGRPRKK
jgi:NRAMP (natural resistance-associated macrophage protein)-like metal ion transporter